MTGQLGGEVSSEEAFDAFYAALLDDDPTQLYERAPCGYLSTTPDGTIIKVNETFLTLTGYERQQLVGRKTFSELLTAGGRIYHETHYAPLLRLEGAARQIALDIVKADNQRLPVLVNALVDTDDLGQPLVVRTAVFDATDRRSYERELLRAKEEAEESERRAVLLARTLQRMLIPPAPPSIPGVDLVGSYRPAGRGDEVGGDFYDVFAVGADDWMLVVGDVRGKGAEAAVVTALVRHTIRAAAVEHRDPSSILRFLNRVLLLEVGDRFCTVVLVRLVKSADAWVATIGVAGHPPPLHCSTTATGPAVRSRGVPGTVAGVLEEVEVGDDEVALGPGDVLLLYTDGVTEARRDLDFYGESRLAEALARHRGAPDVGEAILREVLAFQGGVARDDIAILAVRIPDGVPTPR